MIMVKPALAYLDVISDVRAEVDVPVAAYHVINTTTTPAVKVVGLAVDGKSVFVQLV
jgi:delta-aminolevulinic acid dehydratase/porphobilinogen synthase